MFAPKYIQCEYIIRKTKKESENHVTSSGRSILIPRISPVSLHGLTKSVSLTLVDTLATIAVALSKYRFCKATRSTKTTEKRLKSRTTSPNPPNQTPSTNPRSSQTRKPSTHHATPRSIGTPVHHGAVPPARTPGPHRSDYLVSILRNIKHFYNTTKCPDCPVSLRPP